MKLVAANMLDADHNPVTRILLNKTKRKGKGKKKNNLIVFRWLMEKMITYAFSKTSRGESQPTWSEKRNENPILSTRKNLIKMISRNLNGYNSIVPLLPKFCVWTWSLWLLNLPPVTPVPLHSWRGNLHISKVQMLSESKKIMHNRGEVAIEGKKMIDLLEGAESEISGVHSDCSSCEHWEYNKVTRKPGPELRWSIMFSSVDWNAFN